MAHFGPPAARPQPDVVRDAVEDFAVATCAAFREERQRIRFWAKLVIQKREEPLVVQDPKNIFRHTH